MAEEKTRREVRSVRGRREEGKRKEERELKRDVARDWW